MRRCKDGYRPTPDLYLVHMAGRTSVRQRFTMFAHHMVGVASMLGKRVQSFLGVVHD